MLAAVAWAPSAIGRPWTPIVVAAAVPLILTPRIVSAFFREVLELDPRRAMARTWVTFVSLFGIAIALVPRVLEWFA